MPQCHWSRDGKIESDIDFFNFLGVICRFSIFIRIEVHFFRLHRERERAQVACKSLRSASCLTRFTRDLRPFISQCKQKSVLQSLIEFQLFCCSVYISNHPWTISNHVSSPWTGVINSNNVHVHITCQMRLLASCQVSSNSVQRFQRRSRKSLSQSEARAAILFFRSARKIQTW